MTEETKTLEKLTRTAKAALLEAIASAAGRPYSDPTALESLGRAYAAVVSNGPVKGDLSE